jgi:glycine/D-amino acid oxidase-like deaminating enzyme/thioredoxin reductase/Fe-S-cluster-containing hydrogenase component 2/bacterioferritin-associated ferredoxin
MHQIKSHPILTIPPEDTDIFIYEGKKIKAQKALSIASALHRAGYPVHSHSLENRERSLECGIGKCGACEMLVDGQIRRICITSAEGVKEVKEIPKDFQPKVEKPNTAIRQKLYKTTAVIIGAGPAGLACREELNQKGVANIVVDNNAQIGGQFLMQTHQFFFFEKEKKFGGMRGFDIAKTLAGDNHDGIFLNSVVWDILEGKRLAVKNIKTDEIYYIEADELVVATGAVPFMPSFENDDLPGVYTAAVVQKMMNTEFTLLGKNVLTVGAGNIGYLTSYQLMQAGAKVKAIVEAAPREGGFPVQANRVRRLGIPVLLSKMLTEAIPNADHTGITGAVIADCVNFKPIPGTEQVIEGIDAINICTGLVADDQLLTKGYEIFGRSCYGAGDAIRIGEGTSAVLRGREAAFEIFKNLNFDFNYREYLALSKEYIDSQQEPFTVQEQVFMPDKERAFEKPFVLLDCLSAFACNPCEFACPHEAITKTSTTTIPQIDFEKCIGCMKCVYQCPGLAIFGYNLKKDMLFMPIEYEVEEKTDVYLVNNKGEKLGEGRVEKIMRKPNKTHIARIKSKDITGEALTDVRSFIVKTEYPEPIEYTDKPNADEAASYICHCDDVSLEEVEKVIGERKFISVDEIKHTTRLGMGACRGKRCIPRLKQVLRAKGISLIGEATPRGPLSNQINMGELYPKDYPETVYVSQGDHRPEIQKAECLIAGGGIGGSALFRYLAEAGKKPVMINYDRGSSWRNIAGGRPNFSLPELSEIAEKNLQIFKDLQQTANIDFRAIKYVTLAHDETMYKALEKSMEWSVAEMIEPNDFQKKISPHFNPKCKEYLAALITDNCWQATPGKVLDLIRKIGWSKGGTILEDCKLIDVKKSGNTYKAIVKTHEGKYIEYHTERFINALGAEAGKFAQKLGHRNPLFPVKHQAFITRRLPMLGINNTPLPMVIDRRNYKGFSAVYGQQLQETGQIIGCASPTTEPLETDKNLKINSKVFLEIISENFTNWIPELSSVGLQAVWAGYYVEPRMYIDTEAGLFMGLRGQGFMLGQYLAKLYVDKLLGKQTPEYFERLSLKGDGLLEKAFK